MGDLVPAPNSEVRPVRFVPDYSIDVDKILTASKRAKILAWHIDDVLLADQIMGIYDSFPITCRGKECPFAPRCELSNDTRFLDTPCMKERVEGFRLFLSYVREMEVSATSITDITMIGNIIKLELYIKRMELQLSDEFMTEEITTTSGRNVTVARQMNILLAEMRNCRKEVKDLYDKLLISRESRLKKDLAEGSAMNDAISTLATVMKSRAKLKGKNSTATLRSGLDPEDRLP